MRKILITLIVVIAALMIFVGCNASFEGYSESSLQITSRSDFSAPSYDGIELDGSITEQAWSDSIHHVHNESGVTIDTAVVFGKNGLYIAVDVADKGIYHNIAYDHGTNSSIAVFIMRSDEEPVNYWKKYVVITVDAVNDIVTLPIPYAAKTIVKGELNTPSAYGMSTEIYVPYYSFGFVEKPNTIDAYVNYNKVRGTSTATSIGQWIKSGRMDVGGLFYTFDENGYTDADENNDVMGDSKQGASKTGGWDLSKKSEGVYRSEDNDNQWLFVRDAYASAYSIEATMKIVGGINDNMPQFGLLAAGDEDEKYAMLIEGAPATVASKRAVLRILTLDGTWTTKHTGVELSNVDLVDGGVKLTVFRDGKNFFYLINGELVYSEALPIDGNTTCGFYTVGGEAIYSGVKFVDYTDRTLELYSALNEYSGSAVVIPDGISGGKIETDASVVKENGSFTARFIAQSGYALQSIMLNGRIVTNEVFGSVQNGEWTIRNVTESQRLSATFRPLSDSESVTISGRFTSEREDGLGGTKLILTGPKFVYEGTVGWDGRYSVTVEKNEYDLYVKAQYHWAATKSVDASNDDVELADIVLLNSKGLDVNANIIGSNGAIASGNTTYEYGDESTQATKVGLLYTLLDNSLGETQMVTATLRFVERTNDYNCSAGFVFTSTEDSNGDGKAEDAFENGFTILWHANGIRSYNFNRAEQTGWQNGVGTNLIEGNLGLKDFRESDTLGSETITIVRKGTSYYVFRIIDGNAYLLTTRTYDGFTSEAAIGFMTSGCIARYENYSFSVNEQEVDEFLRENGIAV